MVEITSTFTKSLLFLAHRLHGCREPFREALVCSRARVFLPWSCAAQPSSLHSITVTSICPPFSKCQPGKLSRVSKLGSPCWTALPVTGTARAKRWSHPQPIPASNPGCNAALLLQQGDQIPQMPREKITFRCVHRDEVASRHGDSKSSEDVSSEVKGMPF